MRSPILLVFVLVTVSCAASNSSSTASPTEIADHPAILYKKSIPTAEMTLRGVKLGDPRTNIPPQRVRDTVSQSAAGGWIICRDGCRYQFDHAGVITTLGLWDSRILDQFNIQSPDDVESCFGHPDSIDHADPVQIYRYRGGHVSVLWNTLEKQVNAVNVSN